MSETKSIKNTCSSVPLDDIFYMRAALQEARRAFDLNEVPVGAVVVTQGNIVGKGYNQTERLKDNTAHAEMIALSAAQNHLGSKYLTEATLYVSLEPCLMCASATRWTQLQRLVYACCDPQRGFSQYQHKKANTSDGILHPRTETHMLAGALSTEAAMLIKNFFKNLRS